MPVDRFQVILAVVGFAVSASACVGTMEEKNPNRIVADGSPFADADPFAPDADIPDCAAAATPPGDGYHFPGEDCVQCHSQAGGAPPFTMGGTLYVDGDGSAPLAGATIIVDDAAGNRFTMVTETNGNFYSLDAITFPVLTYATRCPDVIPMVTNVPQASASCNSASCHSPGFRVHLP
jgi:hypothetical protein